MRAEVSAAYCIMSLLMSTVHECMNFWTAERQEGGL